MRIIRLFRDEDTDQIARLFYETIRTINRRDYSSNQLKAWAPDDLYFRNWAQICSSRYTYVAEENNVIIGFGELEPHGHIDCFYSHKDFQGCGVGTAIYRAIKAKALALSLPRLFTETSITALPFFQRQGFSLVKQQVVRCRGELFINYVMEIYL